MRQLKLIAQARGLRPLTGGVLVASVALAALATHIQIQLQPAEYHGGPQIIQTGILLGLSIPMATLLTLLRDRSGWLVVSGSRSRRVVRSIWVSALALGALVIGTLISLLATPGTGGLVVVDFVLLFALGLISCVLFGGDVSWVPPVGVALACSTPGFVPFEFNWIVQTAYTTEVAIAAAALTAVGVVLFAWLDDYGLNPGERLFRRANGNATD